MNIEHQSYNLSKSDCSLSFQLIKYICIVDLKIIGTLRIYTI